jgi:site-specific recombinase XerD
MIPPPTSSLEQIFATHLRTLATTLQPSTINGYRYTVRNFLGYLHAAFPEVHRLSQLRRDPHIVGWLRKLAEQQPPLSSTTRRSCLCDLRRLLEDFADQGHRLPPQLIRRQDFPPRPCCLPRALSPEEDQRLQQELRRRDDLTALALLLTRLTGMRIGECIDLPLDCLRPLGPQQWALHVPLGKLHTERLVPADEDIRTILARILSLRSLAPAAWLTRFPTLLLPRLGDRGCFYKTLLSALAEAAQSVQCSRPVVPHQLRHTFASEMVRLGTPLPVLMRLLGHTDIRMTLRYVTVTQLDLQRQFFQTRQNTPSHPLPNLFTPPDACVTTSDLPHITRALAATRHLLEMFRRQLTDQAAQAKLRHLDRRLLDVASQLEQLPSDGSSSNSVA